MRPARPSRITSPERPVSYIDCCEQTLRPNTRPTETIVIVTGVSPNSIGADTARAIVAQRPAQLILASKTESNLHGVIKSLQIPEGTTVRPLVLNLGSLDAVRKAAFEVSGWTKAIDAAIFTAGVMAVPEYTTSEDGIELHFAVNHLGHFLFANLLVDKLLAGNATVVNYSSEAHKRASPGFLDDLTYDNGKGYDKWAAYDNSKLCNIAFSVGLVQHFGRENLRSFAIDPGVILASALTRSVPPEDFVSKGQVPSPSFSGLGDLC
ncbi:NAD(P)-binding protein [Coniochaeta ligniaria NRRL 30616]|uniref:NAD(P)-binding protein n=1 Tax=Coniochaeta ligniaria NRRL 30616 TaxID=1408157 RepID=A0A1J7IZV1_9PEZI|nr:NAD(P)-binding protein [Coniochaeta ligniaria NRRL 30616]